MEAAGGFKKKVSPTKPKGRACSPSSMVNRPCKEHSFLTDVADVRVMEQGLLQLLDDFHSGKLQAFGGTDMFEKLNEIREKQEQLAQLHFELDLQQDMRRLPSEEARTRKQENLNKMIGKLQGLSTSIQQLQKTSGFDLQSGKWGLNQKGASLQAEPLSPQHCNSQRNKKIHDKIIVWH